MKFEPIGAPVVSYSFGPAPQAGAQDAPTSKPASRSRLVYNGQEYDPERIPWPVWQQMAGEFAHIVGWSFCRMGIRTGNGASMNLVFGVVSGCFGIFPGPFIHADGNGHRHRVLAVLLHLPSAGAIGIFNRLEDARDAGEITAKLAVDWTSEQGWDDNIDRAHAAWAAADLLLLPEAVMHPDGGPLMKLWGRADLTVDLGEKRSLS